MKKENLKIVRIFAIALSVMLGTLTLCNLLTIMTHGIELDIPDEDKFSWAVDPVNKRMLVTSEFTVKNMGAYDIEGIDIRAKVITDQGLELLAFQDYDLVVSSGTSKRFDILLDISLEEFQLENWLTLLYRDSTLSLIVDIDAEYMFGLIDVTVDEVLDYGWTAPLSKYVNNTGAVPWLMGAFGYSMFGLDMPDLKALAVEYLMEIEAYDYADAGYSILLNGYNVEGGLRNLECSITVPVKEIEGSILLDFMLQLGLEYGTASITIQEVSVGYVRQ